MRVIRVVGKDILLLTAYFEHSTKIRSEIDANLMQDVCLLTTDGTLPSIWEQISIHRQVCGQIRLSMESNRSLQKLGASVITPMSTLIPPLIHNCEVVKSVHWGRTTVVGYRSTLISSRSCPSRSQVHSIDTPQHGSIPCRSHCRSLSADAFSRVASHGAKTDKKPPQTSWSTLWRLGTTLLPSIGRVWGTKIRSCCLEASAKCLSNQPFPGTHHTQREKCQLHTRCFIVGQEIHG